MTTVAALSDNVKFVNKGKTQYRVETILKGNRSGWKQHFDTFADAVKWIEDQKQDYFIVDRSYLVTEVFTKTMGVF